MPHRQFDVMQFTIEPKTLHYGFHGEAIIVRFLIINLKILMILLTRIVVNEAFSLNLSFIFLTNFPVGV